MDKCEALDILQLSFQYKNVFFDCFDTLFHRRQSTLAPLVLFAEYLIGEYGFDFEASVLAKTLQVFLNISCPIEESLSNVYFHFRPRMISRDDFVSQSKRHLEAIELSLLLPADNVLELLNKLSAKKKTISIVSDFYLGASFIRRAWNKYFGLPIRGIFVSSDQRSSKTEKLYSIALGGLEPCETLMVGDNHLSDGTSPRIIGIRSYLLDASSWKHKYACFEATRTRYLYGRLNELWNSSKYTWASNFVYLIFFYCKKLYVQLERDDLVNFLAREGQFLKRCFDYYLS